MRKSLLVVVCTVLGGVFMLSRIASAEEAKKEAPKAEAAAKADVKAPEFIVFDKAKMGAVKFPHKLHIEKFGGETSCATCHGGDKPLFKQEKTELKMADMYAGSSCGHCHNGKEGADKKVVFAAKGACMKCHKKG